MLMNFFLWILMAAAVGWLAGLILKTDEQLPMKNLLVGVAGAVVGHVFARALGLGGLHLAAGPSPYAAALSLAGATAVLMLLNVAYHGEARGPRAA